MIGYWEAPAQTAAIEFRLGRCRGCDVLLQNFALRNAARMLRFQPATSGQSGIHRQSLRDRPGRYSTHGQSILSEAQAREKSGERKSGKHDSV